MAVSGKRPGVALRVESELVAARRPAVEAIGLRIVAHRTLAHADNDIALRVELQFMRAAPGIARPAIAAIGIAPGPGRTFELHLLHFAGFTVEASHRVGEMIGIIRILIIHDDVVRPDIGGVAPQHEQIALSAPRQVIFRHHNTCGRGIGRPRPLFEWNLVG